LAFTEVTSFLMLERTLYMNRKIVFAALLVALFVAAFSSVSAQETVTLVLWHAKQDAEGDGLLAQIEAFQEANPGIVVEQVFNPSNTLTDQFTNSAATGEGPDMVLWANDAAGNWASAGLIIDITEWVSEDLLAQATESAWGTFTYEGSIYGVPNSAKTLTLFYNRSLVPEAPATWAEVLEISAELAEDDITGLAFQNGFFHSAGFLYSLGGSLMTDEGLANFGPDFPEGQAAMEAYLQFHQDMYNLSLDESSGVIIDGSSPNPLFQQGEVAMVYDGIWNLAQFESDLGDDLGVALMPALDNGEVPALFAQTEGYMVSPNLSDDEAKQAAFVAWATFITSVEGQTIGSEVAGLLPVNPEVEVESENLQVFAEQFALGTPFPNRPELSAFWGPMGEAITAVSAGGLTPAEASEIAYEAISATIAETQGGE
jgi:arabinogalactan oligomer/maltooligosaccharide transport system substrate-binding protein